jgi:hypothetical protein
MTNYLKQQTMSLWEVRDFRFTRMIMLRCTAGISGALLAYHLTHPEEGSGGIPEGSKIVILEGSEVSSSASE